MKAMQNLVKVPEIQATMRELSKEMMKVRRSTTNIHKTLGHFAFNFKQRQSC